MTLTAHLVSVVVAIAMLASGSLKLARTERIVGLMGAVGVRGPALTMLGALQVAATVGLIVGLWIPSLGLAAAIGLVLYFAGAVGAHLRVHDPDWQAAAVLLGVSIATSTLLTVAL